MPVRERVSLARCAGYDLEEVEASLRAALAPLGGIEAFVRPGQRVVLKPNLLRPASPDAAATTHPAVVAAVARLVVAAGAEALILDSSGGPNSTAYLTMVHRTTGMTWAAEASGARLVADLHATQVPLAKGLILHRVDLVREAIEADVLINLPKLKTHGLTGLTVAVKNLFGLVPGVAKVGYHGRMQDPEAFAKGLLDVSLASGAALHIVDAVVGMEGNGPSAGTPREVGAILAGRSALAVDTAAAALVGRDPLDVRTTRIAAEAGLCSGRIEDVEIAGDSLEGLQGAPFRLPEGYAPEGHAPQRQSLFGRIATGWFSRQLLVTPQAGERCTGCGLCARHCPVDAITMENGRGVGARARMDAARCIRCYCCHELCPALAVELRKPVVGRLLGRF